MGSMNIQISDELERKFRHHLIDAGMKGNLSKGAEEAIKMWVEKSSPNIGEISAQEKKENDGERTD